MRTLRYPVRLLPLLLFFSFFLACTRRSPDDKMAEDIRQKVAADPDTKDSQVNVAAKDGKVTLSGKVRTPAAQQKVEQIAREEPGTAGVDDQSTIDPAMEVAPAMAAAPPPPPVEKPKPQPIVVPAGTVLTIRTEQALSSKTSQAGQTFLATLAQPVSVAGRPALVAGSTVSGTVVT